MLLALAFFDDLLNAWQRYQDGFWPQTFLFVSLTLRGLGLALLAGIPAGIFLSRVPKLATPAIGVLAVLQTIPSLVLLGLFLPLLGIGETPALFAAVVYSLFPIVLNTCVGIRQVAAAIRDAARGMGMTDNQILWHVELPLAFPVIMVGVRTAAIYAGAMIVIGAFIGARGLGDFIVMGLSRNDPGLIWLGAIPVLLFTVLLFWSLGGLAWLSAKNSWLGMSLGGGLIVILSAYAVFGFAEQALQPGRTDIVIGAKNFTEGQILTEIMKQVIETHTKLKVEVKSNLGTSMILDAVKTGDIDMYAEYTGNLLTGKGALDMPVPADKSIITDLVRREMRRRYDLILLDTFGLNNTYAPSVARATAQKYRLKRISDLQRVPQFRVIIDQSFLDRPDGWRGLVEKYQLHFDSPPRQISPDLLYKALEKDAADVVIGFATDWQIQSLNLVVLKDDRGYFPSYHAAPLVRAQTLQRHPEIATALNRLAGRIDDATMRRLNYEVAVKQRSEAEVAREFLGALKRQ